jgi:anaerobic glycerol-3-phosphate dehydrogenase
MKHIIFFTSLTLFFSTYAQAGFFNETGAKNKAEYIENDRLCKLFTKKIEDYKKDIRKDVLATASLASYEFRAELFCKKAEEAKKSL